MKNILPFYKYQGTGNDFVIVDGIKHQLSSIDKSSVEFICNRKFGIGADGLMIISKSDDFDFEMVYYNSDGGLSTMCGNGGRCIAHLAHSLGYAGQEVNFVAADGPHKAWVHPDHVSLEMCDVNDIQKVSESDYVLNTGSPHYVRISEVSQLDQIVELGRSIRYSEPFSAEGINVNLVAPQHDIIHVATYERGVEDETLSCGTGVTAAALVASYRLALLSPVEVVTKGGRLRVSFQKNEAGFTHIVLHGPAVQVFTGQIAI